MINMKSKITTILTFIICAYTIISAGAAESSAYEIDTCQNLTIENGNYLLNQSISSDMTCITISADNITLDGNGYTITYGLYDYASFSGYGIDNSGGYDNITIKNLNIVQGGTSRDSYAIYFNNGATDGNIKNNTVMTSSDCLFFDSSSANNITNNNITSSDNGGINFFYYSDSNIISQNIITTTYSVPVTFLWNCNSNVISDNLIRSKYGFGIYIGIGEHNKISDNDIISGVGIYTESDSVTISNNNITASGTGMRFDYSSNHKITGNRMNTTEEAIFIYPKTLQHYNHTIDATNTQNGDPIYYYFSESSSTLENQDVGQLFIINSTNMTVRNVNLDNSGIILDTVTNSKITDSRISTQLHGIYARNINSNIISDNIITTEGHQRRAIYLDSSNLNTLSDNTLLSTAHYGSGIYLNNSKKNTISGGSIISRQGYDYYIGSSSSGNYFIETNFTSTRGIVLYSNSFFDYNNNTASNISLKTNVSRLAGITRTLVKWSKNELIWNDTNISSDSLTASYNITGLSPNTFYNIYNTSEGTQTNSYTLTTDSKGNLPSFTIALKGNTEIKVKDKPPKITIDYPEHKTIIPSDTTYFNITTDENATCTYSYSGYDVPTPSYTSHYSCDSSGCVGQSIPVPDCGCRSSYKIMDITGTTKHSQNVRIHWSLLRYENIIIANCTDSAGNSNTSSISVISRNKPLTIDALNPDNNMFNLNKTITIYVKLTTNYSIDQLRLNIKRPDNTSEIYDEDDFSEKVGAKQFMKLINMTYANLTLTGNYTLDLYVNDTEGNIDTATKTFSAHPAINHIINNSKNSDPVNVYYQNPKRAGTYESLAHLTIYPGGYSNITLPRTELDLYFYYGTYYEFNVIIPALDLSEFQKLTIEGKNINKSNITLHPRYTAKDAYVFNIKNSSSMNKQFKVEFDYFYSDVSDPKKIVIFKAPYNSTTNKTYYDSAIYYSLGNPDHPLYYNSTTEKAWIFVNSLSIFALLEDKATAEICGDGIDNDYDGSIDEGCSTGGGGSSSSSYSSGPPIIIHECENNTGCSTDQICENFKCINITCSYCEYIENHECIKYECCEDKDCEDNYSCKNHQCIKQEENTTIEDNPNVELRTIEETNEPETKYTPPKESESTNILGYAIKNLSSKTTLAAIMIWLAIIALVFLTKDKIRNIILGK